MTHAGKPGGNREDKHQPVPLGEPGLLTKVGPSKCGIKKDNDDGKTLRELWDC